METRCKYELYIDATLIGRGDTQSCTWKDAEETLGKTRKDFEGLGCLFLVEETYDSEAHEWVETDCMFIPAANFE